MASPHVLYYCPCSHSPPRDPSGSSGSSAPSQASTDAARRPASSLASPPPGLPASSPASNHTFHPLESLYFCDECDQIRCNRCVTLDISSYYCPNCLFEVPGASVKAEKNRCARNCFTCPCCQHTLSVLASDFASEHARSLDPTDPIASQGTPPYYLGCSFCRWDSKSIGLVFEKPTGLSLQLQRNEENAPDVLEFERLKDHFDPYLKAQTQAAITSAAIGSSTSRSRSSASSSTTTASEPLSSTNSARFSRSSRANAARSAAAAALTSSKLLRDLPHLSHSRHSHALSSSAARSAPIEPDEIKPYRALNPWQPPTDARRTSESTAAIGVVAKREKHRRDYIARLQPAPNQPLLTLDHKIASLQQRWSSVSIADQPVRAADLRPSRVPLKSKLSKRCPACRHIVIKPDIKAASNRFKIKLVALNFLPEIQVALASSQPYLDPLRFRTTSSSAQTSGATGSLAGSLRRRPLSVLATGGAGQASEQLGTTASSIAPTSHDVDLNDLAPGQTYSFQVNMTNPLDDPIEVQVNFVRFAPPQRATSSSSSQIDSQRDAAVQALPEPRYIFSSACDTNSSSDDQSMLPTQPKEAGLNPKRRPRLGWQVYPSAHSVPLNAFNEVWELEESGDLFSSRSEAENAHKQSDSQANDTSRRPASVKTAIVRSKGADPDDPSAWVIQEQDQDEDDDDGFDDTDDEAAFDPDPMLSHIEEEKPDPGAGSTSQPTSFHSAQRARRQRASLLSSARTRQRPGQASSAGAIQRPPFVQKGHTTTIFLDLAISSKDPPAPGPIELGMHVTYRYTTSAGENAEPPPTGKDFSFWTSVRFGNVASASHSPRS